MLKSLASDSGKPGLTEVEGAAHYELALLQLCKAGGELLRLQVLRILQRDAFTVQELCQILDCRQSGLSHHLKILSAAGLLTRRREGNSLFYRRCHLPGDIRLGQLHEALLRSADAIAVSTEQQAQLQAVYEERSLRSKAFFSERAGQFTAQQEQMVAYAVYGHSAAELLDSSRRGSELAVEIGPGEGLFLGELAQRYRRVVGIDNSERMLDCAARFVDEQQLTNVELLLGDGNGALTLDKADCVVANMVLHHLPSPADVFASAADMLKSGGLFCVTELCRHDQNWARDACGDIWLGFEPEDLSEWASAAGLEEGPASYLAQLNGFRVQIRQFFKAASAGSAERH